LILLETYTSNRSEDFKLPPFLEVQSEVTGDLDYSMYNLSKKLDPELSTPPTNEKPETETKRNTEPAADTKVEDSAAVMPTTSVLVDHPEMPVVQKITSELKSKVVASGGKNGYHIDIARDHVASLTLGKLDSSAILNGEFSQDGDVFFGDAVDYERFARWCHSGKSGAAVK